MIKQKLTKKLLHKEANIFAKAESNHQESSIFGITDGKAIGTYLEHKFQNYLSSKYQYIKGSSSKGIDFPELFIDLKVTSIKQPQSSCPFRSARQKIFGLGYSLLIFVYEKNDNNSNKTGSLNIRHTIFVDDKKTGDFQTTSGLIKIIENDGNIDDIQKQILAEEVLYNPPEIGYLTISNALQWRLQYSRVIKKAGEIEGINKIF